MNELAPILAFLSENNFKWGIDEEGILRVADDSNRYYEECPYEGVLLPLLNIDELHSLGLEKSLMNLDDFSDTFIDELIYYVKNVY